MNNYWANKNSTGRAGVSACLLDSTGAHWQAGTPALPEKFIFMFRGEARFMGDYWENNVPYAVIPAKAGIHLPSTIAPEPAWIPAFADFLTN